MHRLKVAPGTLAASEATIDGAALRYLRDVLRLRVGDAVELFDGAGTAASAQLTRVEADGAALSVGEVRQVASGAVRITLAQGLPKSDKLELVLQKAVELGATALVPLACERSIVKLDGPKAVERVARWQKIADEAARQCGRADTLQVLPVQSLRSFVAQPSAVDEVRLLLDEEERTVRLRDRLVDASAHHLLLVGPEGGLARSEVEAARAGGYQPVTLGPRVLRTETVGLAAISVVQFALGDFG